MKHDERAIAILKEAAEWHLLELLFQCPVGQWHARLAAVAAEVDDPLLKQAVQLAQQEANEGLFHSTLGPGGPAAAREVSYHDTIQLGYLMSELTSYYEAFAYRPETEEARDHVSVEAGFMSYLRLKEAYALGCGEPEAASIAADAARKFMSDHLTCIAQPLAASLAHSGVEYLVKASQSLAARTGPARRLPVIEPLCTLPEDAFEFECGSAGLAN